MSEFARVLTRDALLNDVSPMIFSSLIIASLRSKADVYCGLLLWSRYHWQSLPRWIVWWWPSAGSVWGNRLWLLSCFTNCEARNLVTRERGRGSESIALSAKLSLYLSCHLMSPRSHEIKPLSVCGVCVRPVRRVSWRIGYSCVNPYFRGNSRHLVDLQYCTAQRTSIHCHVITLWWKLIS